MPFHGVGSMAAPVRNHEYAQSRMLPSLRGTGGSRGIFVGRGFGAGLQAAAAATAAVRGRWVGGWVGVCGESKKRGKKRKKKTLVRAHVI